MTPRKPGRRAALERQRRNAVMTRNRVAELVQACTNDDGTLRAEGDAQLLDLMKDLGIWAAELLEWAEKNLREMDEKGEV